MIRRESGRYVVRGQSGRKMGSYRAKGEAVKRLQQIEYFKAKKGGK